MTKRMRTPLLALAGLSTTFILLMACPGRDAADSRAGEEALSARAQTGEEPSPVTPVEGPSWLHHLGLELADTRMGQMGGDAPQPGARGEEPVVVTGPFRLSGADLYRLDCRSCHGPDGTGSPPEIKSLLEPVRGASPEALRERMEKLGTSLDDARIQEITSQVEDQIRERLRNGGEKMPSFEHLRDDEVDALLGYLQELAGVDAGKRAGMLVPQSAARVGEHLVKGTCHTCHDATGPGGHHEVMMSGIVPSLASFPEQYSLDSVVDKVETGASGGMGRMGMMGMMRREETMPRFPYLSRDEVAAAYLYLRTYPPKP